ncbi:acyltransferase [Achromobacter piechaudii ATCC 43553]|uniref:Acyltransferase n=2 Tax=Achromobacter piechaudii TaxID=72556 RepID=D4XJR9_9BURK|nr:acyltransferase [Achromobacter piechaudii ATCC 43553]
MATKYQPGIDALRAVAVLAVLLFHLDLPWASGGFVGVDVFFVISGYLITQSIINEGPGFSLRKFYRRRFMRLYPALIVTIAMVLAVGYLLTDPATFKETAKSSIWAALSASNFFFWLNQGYFDAAAQTQPLLHTWTLGAEWQFYVIWAPLIAFVPRRGIWVPGVLIASLIASQWMLSIDSSASYFLMPMRMFELALGAALAMHPLHLRAPGVSAAAGLGLIVLSTTLYDAGTPFPGVAALIPCVAAIAWIAGAESRIVRFASNPITLYLGKISYSVYLVHWPIIVMAKYYWFGPLSTSQSIFALAASIALGSALFHLVERPLIRSKGFVPVAASIFATGAAISIAFAVDNHNGLPERVPADYAARYSNPTQFHAEHYGGNGYELDTPLGERNKPISVLLAGDSFALQYASGIDPALASMGRSGRGLFAHGCYFGEVHTRFDNGAPLKGCRERYEDAIDALEGNEVPLVLAQHWVGYITVFSDLNGRKINFKDADQYYETLLSDLAALRAKIGSRVLILVGSPPNASAMNSAASCMFRPRFFSQPCEAKMTYDVDSTLGRSINRKIKQFALAHPNTYFVDPASSLCTAGKCSMIKDGAVLFSDGEHLSREGASAVSSEIMKVLTANFAR